MLLFCTSAPNDADLVKELGPSAHACPIPEGDVVFWGVGDNDGVLRVCIERKKIGDLASCILDGRYLSQAQAAKSAGMDVLCLIVEGEMRQSPVDGVVEVPVWRFVPTPGLQSPKRKQMWEPLKPAITYSRLDQYLTELQYLVGIIVKRSADVRETAAMVKALWVNFQMPPSKHNSLHHIYAGPVGGGVLLSRPSLLRRIAKEIPGIGWDRSGDVATHFRSVKAMVNAPAKEWLSIPGVGKKTAQKAVESLNGGRVDQQEVLP